MTITYKETTMRKVLVLAAFALFGCTHYRPVVNATASDRLWLVSEDGRTVIRCYDMTPPTVPFRGGLEVFCKEASNYGTLTNPMTVEQSGIH